MASETAQPLVATTEAPVTPDATANPETPATNKTPSTPDPSVSAEASPAPTAEAEPAALEERSSAAQQADSTPQTPADDPAPSVTTEPSGTPPWREKAGVILTQSSTKLAVAASKAGSAVVGAAEVTGSKVKATWESTKEGWQTNVQPRVHSTWQSTKEGWQTAVQPKVDAAARVAAETGAKIKKGFIQTRDKVASVAVHKRVAEATKNSLERSRTFLVKMEILPPELNPRAVFGVPLEKVVGYQSSPEPVPHIVVACTEFIEKEGMLTEYLFDDEGDPMMITRLMKIYERDDQSNIPPGYIARDVAQLLLAFFRCLPEPVLTYKLYEDVVAVGGGDALRLRELLSTLPAANLATLARVAALLARVAKEEELTKMDGDSLAIEWAPVLLWKGGLAPATARPPVASSEAKAEIPAAKQDLIDGSPLPPEEKEAPVAATEGTHGGTASVVQGTASSQVIKDTEADDLKEHQAIVEAVKCMIVQYEVVFKEGSEGAGPE